MFSDPIDFEKLSEERTKALKASLQPISIEELKKLGEQLFPMHDDAWRERYFSFANENAGSTFHRAQTHDGVEIVYCRTKEKGVWYLPGSGIGILQGRGLKMMKDVVDRR